MDFWQYASDRRRRPAVVNTCLALQHEFALPVMALLAGAWRADQGLALDEQQARELRAQAEAFEQRLSGAELEMDRLLAGRLEALLIEMPAGAGQASVYGNLTLLAPEMMTCERMGTLLERLAAALEA